jgi:hypothetical protein
MGLYFVLLLSYYKLLYLGLLLIVINYLCYVVLGYFIQTYFQLLHP